MQALQSFVQKIRRRPPPLSSPYEKHATPQPSSNPIVRFYQQHKKRSIFGLILLVGLAFLGGAIGLLALKEGGLPGLEMGDHGLSSGTGGADDAVSSSPPATPGTGAGATDDFAKQALSAHNNARAQYGAPLLDYDATLASGALQWAKHCQFEHSMGSLDLYSGDYGENLAAEAGSDVGAYTIQDAVDSWMSENTAYDYSDPSFGEDTGHFTQVVWVGTTKVGCALIQCNLDTFPSDMQPSAFAVCEYYPAGNVMGQFAQNVKQKSS